MYEIAIAKYLAGQKIVTFDENRPTADCFIGMFYDSPDDAVKLTAVSGHKPDAKFGYDSPSLQVITRSRSFRDGVARAQRIYDALQSLSTITLDEGGADEVRLLDCQAVQSSPFYMGTDENNRHKWTQNFDLEIKAPSAHRR